MPRKWGRRMHVYLRTLLPSYQTKEKEKVFALGPRDPRRIDCLKDANGTAGTANQECNVHQGIAGDNTLHDTRISIPGTYAREPRHPSMREALSMLTDKVRSPLTTPVVHSTHVDTAPLNTLPKENNTRHDTRGSTIEIPQDTPYTRRAGDTAFNLLPQRCDD